MRNRHDSHAHGQNNDDGEDSSSPPLADIKEDICPWSGSDIAKNESAVVIKTVLDQHIDSKSNSRSTQAGRATKLRRSPRKLATPDIQVCPTGNCRKQFNRLCDLRKHETVHSRLWKCPEEKCKFFILGFSSQADRNRHVTDKHCSGSLK
jgi:hypothetical protein